VSDPVVTYSLPKVLDRIEGKLDVLAGQQHKLELAMAASAATVVADTATSAHRQARTAIWVAAAALVAAGVPAWVALLRGH
jgi:hypothetical protein